MKTSASFPQLDMRVLAIKDQLMGISDKSSWGFSILHALIYNTHPLKDIVKMILDQYYAAPESVLDVISQETINLIKEVYGYKSSQRNRTLR